jgi:hypothetical protein
LFRALTNCAQANRKDTTYLKSREEIEEMSDSRHRDRHFPVGHTMFRFMVVMGAAAMLVLILAMLADRGSAGEIQLTWAVPVGAYALIYSAAVLMLKGEVSGRSGTVDTAWSWARVIVLAMAVALLVALIAGAAVRTR